MTNEMLLPPGYDNQLNEKIAEAKREMLSGGREMKRLMETRMFICGSPNTVREILEECQEKPTWNIWFALFSLAHCHIALLLRT